LNIFGRYPSEVTRVGRETPLSLNMVSKLRSACRRATEFVAAGAKAKFAPLLTLAFAVSLGACASAVSDLPPQLGGLPAGTPERPAQPAAYPAVHDMPPPRPNTVLTEEERKKAEADLAALRERQEKAAAEAAKGQ
jgi:hypothetical protein